jgi:hypothetical protein
MYKLLLLNLVANIIFYFLISEYMSFYPNKKGEGRNI